MTNIITGVSHPSGILLDQHNFKAIFRPSIWDTDAIGFDSVEWQPLEVILDSFLDIIDQGKVVVFPSGERPPPEEGREQREGVELWVMEPYSEVDLRDALFEFERLIKAIEARMPAGSFPPDVPINYGYINSNEDRNFHMFPKQGFARRFLAAVRRPRFRFIAPGLQFVGADLDLQPFSNLNPECATDATIRPVLLARGEEGANEGANLYFRDVFENTNDDLPCGLYLTEILPDHPYPWEVYVKDLSLRN